MFSKFKRNGDRRNGTEGVAQYETCCLIPWSIFDHPMMAKNKRKNFLPDASYQLRETHKFIRRRQKQTGIDWSQTWSLWFIFIIHIFSLTLWQGSDLFLMCTIPKVNNLAWLKQLFIGKHGYYNNLNWIIVANVGNKGFHLYMYHFWYYILI